MTTAALGQNSTPCKQTNWWLAILLPLMLGFITKDWKQMQSQAFANAVQQSSAVSWLWKIIKGLWEIFSTLWNQRNVIHHSKVKEAHETPDDTTLNSKICLLWDQGRLTLLPNNQAIFKGLCHQLLERPHGLQQAWADKAKAVFVHAEWQMEVPIYKM